MAFLGIFFGLFGVYLISKAAESKNPDVTFYCGISAIISFMISGVSIAFYLS